MVSIYYTIDDQPKPEFEPVLFQAKVAYTRDDFYTYHLEHVDKPYMITFPVKWPRCDFSPDTLLAPFVLAPLTHKTKGKTHMHSL